MFYVLLDVLVGLVKYTVLVGFLLFGSRRNFRSRTKDSLNI